MWGSVWGSVWGNVWGASAAQRLHRTPWPRFSRFHFPTLRHTPLPAPPSPYPHLQSTQFVKLCRDCGIVGGASGLTEAEVAVVYTAEVKRGVVGGGGAPGTSSPRAPKMDYNDFLTGLMRLSVKAYPAAASVDDAFQSLLTECLLPLACRRCPDDVSMFLQHEDVRRLYDYYADSLQQIFQYYASADKRTTKVAAAASASATSGMGTTGSSASSLGSTRSPRSGKMAVNSMKEVCDEGECGVRGEGVRVNIEV